MIKKRNYKAKLVAATLMMSILAGGLVACGSSSSQTSSEDDSSEIANAYDTTLRGLSEEEYNEECGISLPAPEGATDVEYCVYNPDTDNPIGELNFTYEGKSYFLRAQSTDLTSVAITDEDADIANETEELEEKINISGMYDEWTMSAAEDVQYCDAMAYADSDCGFIAWVDAAPGILYNLGTQEETDLETLMNVAETVFVPVQGES